MKKVHVNEFIAVGEIIIPLKGLSIMKQYNKNKPHKWGIKMFALASSNGLVHDFEIYVGKDTLPPSYHRLGISGDIVMGLIECVPKNEKYKFKVSTVCSNRIAAFVLENNKQLKPGERFQFDTNNNIVVTKWHDNEVVHVISNYKGPLPVENVKRWSVAEKKKFMSLDQRQLLNEKTMSLLKFMLEIFHALLQCGKVLTPKRGRPLSNIPSSKKSRTFTPRPTNVVRYDETGHWPIRVLKKQSSQNPN
ncbi:hypothetical protein QTP88_016315 [Uroleucon formosanum]